jgi:protein-S-isoprenylcysteine O-methyltransferase Ste14
MIQKGMYRFVRHPLYASIIWMFFGASFVYMNYAALLANVCVFIPAMYYRAKQEERLLAQEFPEYQAYQKAVGMFFPKFHHHV